VYFGEVFEFRHMKFLTRFGPEQGDTNERGGFGHLKGECAEKDGDVLKDGKKEVSVSPKGLMVGSENGCSKGGVRSGRVLILRV
jgi:hypothetical protein